ncbi:MAG TPA: DUF350 domain-containing protein [bacterium]|nr:DUF350 domain-containing protein [bacterium]
MNALFKVFGSLFYSFLGIVILVISYKVLSMVVPFDIDKKLAEENNTAVGIFVAGAFVAIGLIVAAAIF